MSRQAVLVVGAQNLSLAGLLILILVQTNSRTQTLKLVPSVFVVEREREGQKSKQICNRLSKYFVSIELVSIEKQFKFWIQTDVQREFMFLDRMRIKLEIQDSKDQQVSKVEV